jgi:hypothetical protein
VIAAAVLAVTLAGPGAPRPPARVSLAASPTHVRIAAGGRQAISVTAPGGGPLLLEAQVAGYALDLLGRPRIARPGDAAAWLSVSPRRLTVGRGGGVLVVTSRRPVHARPGDHSAVILLSAVVPSARGVVVRMRIGLAVSVRVAGRIVHRLSVLGARLRRTGGVRSLEVTLTNRGNVTETIGAGGLRITLIRHGRVIARSSLPRRELLPGSRGIVRLRVAERIRGLTLVRVRLRRPGQTDWVERRFRLRL